MFATALIVFRETLEAALFVGIAAAATLGTPGRWRWLSGGVLLGGLGAVALAAGAEVIGTWAEGFGQDLVNAGILGLAFAMLAWHCIWVSTHGREMSNEARRLGSSVRTGTRPPWALLLAVALSVLREGAETVLFVSGLTSGQEVGTSTMVTAVTLGLAGGILAGTLIYFGLSRIKPYRLFQVTNALILLLAASIASQFARALTQAGLISTWTTPVWDTSNLIPTDSAIGAALHAIAGYDAQPSGVQLVFYVGALILIGTATWRVARMNRSRSVRSSLEIAPAAMVGGLAQLHP